MNRNLIGSVASNSAAANLAKAREWLESERSSGVNWFRNRATVDALEQFTNLTLVDNELLRCSWEAFRILWRNDKATEGRAHKPPSQIDEFRRIDSVVHEVMLRHAINCLPVYPKRFACLKLQLDQDNLKLANAFADKLLANNNCGQLNEVSSQKCRKIRGDLGDAQLAYEHIERWLAAGGDSAFADANRQFLGRVPDERSGKLVVNVEQVRKLLDRFVLAPCREFSRTLGPSVFIPARFDALSLEREDRYLPTDSSMADFLSGWLRFRLCESLNEQTTSALSKSLVRFIEAKKFK